MDLLLARQPILDIKRKVYGYELLHRSSRRDGFDNSDGDRASLEVLANTLLSFGLRKVLGKQRGFINFTRRLLLNDTALLLDPGVFVIEILENVEPDAEVIAACRRLREKGYLLALDDFLGREAFHPLAAVADIIKVDFRLTSHQERLRISSRYNRPALRLLAEKVETEEEFSLACREGFSLFQGFFFLRPEILSQREVPAFKGNLLRILAEIHAEEFDFGRLEDLIKREPSLVLRLLRYVNSAAFGWSAKIGSIRQAMALLGEDEMRRWLTLATLPALASDRPEELVRTAMLRARACELLAVEAGLAGRSLDLFLVGMFSLLEAIIGRPLRELLDELFLPSDVREALLEPPPAGGRLGAIYRLVENYEKGEWEKVSELAGELGLTVDTVAQRYLEATGWTEEIFSQIHATA